jgi:diguanylate cyclase (GGDEF)-like protein/PAS domain S-box-containing protein
MPIPLPSQSNLEETIALEKLRQLCKSLPVSVATSTLLALIVGATQASVLPIGQIAGWLTLVISVNLLRLYWLGLQNMQLAAHTATHDGMKLMRLSVTLGGLAWGTSGFLLFPADDPTSQIYLAFALAGLAAGGIIGYSIDMACAFGYIGPALLPFLVRLLIEGDTIHLSMALTVILFLIFTIASIRHLNSELIDNITLRIQATEQEARNFSILNDLAESTERFKSLTELSSDWYWEQDENFRFTHFAAQKDFTTGVANDSLIGKTRWEIGALNMGEADWQAHLKVLLAHQTFHDLELNRINPAGHSFWSSISGRPILDKNGNFKGYRGIGRLITERKLAEDESRRLTYYDTLTGLPNRQSLINQLSHEIAKCARSQQLGALMFIDLDNFKQVNDTHGHLLGDQLLKQVAQRLQVNLRESDTVSRLGGDEFVVILEHLGSNPLEAARQAEMLCEKLLLQLNKPYPLGNQQQQSTPSIGITLIGTSPSDTTEELMRRADAAMYQAKDAGRNTIRFFDPQLQAELAQRALLEVELRRGIDEGQFMLYYQPQVDSQQRVTGVEALLRWQHPQRGLVMPAEFIVRAEETDVILALGHWVLETACRQLVAWSANPKTARLSIAVNVSARQLRQAIFPQQVKDVVRASGADPQRLKLEISEKLLLDNIESTIAKMADLKAHGIGFSLDDFGTGYSSLSYLKRLPLDQLKIDQSFVRDVLTDPNDATIARTILSLGHNLGLTVIAEGVETQAQLDFLAGCGCSAYQGYLFGRPTPIETLKLA